VSHKIEEREFLLCLILTSNMHISSSMNVCKRKQSADEEVNNIRAKERDESERMREEERKK
jgi:hypothetical protein